MGSHTGIVVRDLWEENGHQSGKRFLYRAWNPIERSYVSRRFDSKRDGNLWASTKGARLKTGLDVSGRLELKGIATDFLACLRSEGRAERHIEDVQRILNRAQKAGITDLKFPRLAEQVREWLTGITSSHKDHPDRPLSAASRVRYLTVLKAVIRFALKRDLLARDPLMILKRPALDQTLKATFGIDELRTLLLRADDPYRLQFALLIYTGCRVGEAMHLRWENVRWTEERIEVRLDESYDLKRRRERSIPLQPELAAILTPLAKPEGWIVEDPQRDRASTYGYWFEQFITRAGLPIRDRSPHSTRHTYISLMLATGENFGSVKDYAGHRSLVTTEGYAQSQERYRSAVKAWPRGEFRLLTEQL